MKRYILPLLLISISLSSCNLFGKDEGFEKAKGDAITAINNAGDEAVKSAESKINEAVLKTMQDANQDLAAAIDSAKADIKNSVDISVEKKLKGLNEEIADAQRLSGIVGILAIVAIIICVVLFFTMRSFNKNLRDTVVEIVTGSEGIDASTRINKHLEDKIKNSISKQTFRSEEFDRAVLCILFSGKSKDYILNLIKTSSTSQKEKTSLSNNNYGNSMGGSNQQLNSTVKEEPKTEKAPEPKIELFARDSDSEILSGVQSSFQQGKSIYKLILSNKDDSTAEITLVDQEDARRRILRSGDDILSHVCKVERKSSEPQVVTVISSGKAEKKSQDVWVVVSPITVVLS